MKTPIVAALLALSLCASAHAAPPTTESIEKLLSATKVESLVETLRTQVDAQVKDMTQKSFNTAQRPPKEQAVLSDFTVQTTALIQQELAWDKLRTLYVQVYAERFTQKEIDGLLAFYKTPVGQAYVAKMPDVMQKSNELVYQRLSPLTQKIQAMAQQTAEKLASMPREETPPPPAPPASDKTSSAK